MSYSPCGLKESDTTEHRYTHTHTHTHTHSKGETLVELTKTDFDDLCKKIVKYNFNAMSWG